MNQKRIKVFSLATTYPESPESKKPKFVHILNKELVKLGVDVKVIAPHTRGFKSKEMMNSVEIKRFRYLPEGSELSDRSIPDTIKQSRFGKIKVAFMILRFFFFTLFECLKDRPDIIHGQWAFPGGYIASLAAGLVGTKYVVSIHGAETPLLKKYKFILKKTIKSLNNASTVIVNSNYTRNEYEKLGVKKEKMIKINPPPNFVNHISDYKILKKFKTKFGDEDAKIILFVGRLIERKGVEYLIKSLPEIKTQKFHLIIAGDGWLFDHLKKLTDSLNLRDKVTFFGSPSHEELGNLHDISDIFVCPSIIDSKGETEGLGLVILEAMESGLPVIATSVGGIVDIVKNQENGILINQKDSKAIAEAIDRLFRDKEFSEKISQNSKKMVAEFDPINIAKEHFALFQKLLKN